MGRAGSVRPPAVAGSFYPADPARLADAVDALLPPPAADQAAPEAVIAPHAGYEYSGPVAGAALSLLGPARETLRRVVLIGPAHYVPLRGLAVTGVEAFETPFGLLDVDDDARAAALALPQVQLDDAPHAPEHSLEVELPILQRLLGRFSVVPLVTGRAGTAEVADVLDAVWGGPETVVVCSSDLSHYHDHDTATALDQRTAAAIVARDVEAVAPRDACGSVAVRGLLEVARRRDLAVRLLELRTSHDAGGPPDRVVGYGAFALG
ncbi:MAG TPA: AmmeMemoRadiSam system protein B [Acidimicrobiales bacterium]|nr:AmmeMemoRadiSam system protein B [Acidimicrobiales bacterium]